MSHQAPVRRQVNISARTRAQLELRLHWLTRALAIRGGYILAMRRRSTVAGRHVAAVAYEMPLPKFAPPIRGERRGAARYAGGGGEWSLQQGQETSPESV
jgi:hypothetical protein